MNRRPIIVAYDISSNRIRAKVHKILKDWRLGGQKSVHECCLEVSEAEELFLQITEILDPDTDALMMTWIEPHRSVLFRGCGCDDTGKNLIHIR